MTTITGSVKKFKTMFELIMCGAKYPLFTDTILEIDSDIITVNSVDSTRAIGTNQKYEGFEIVGSKGIPIETIPIYEAIKLFDDNNLLTLEYDNNKITLFSNSNSEKNTVTIPCSDDTGSHKSNIEFTTDSVMVNGNKYMFDSHAIFDVKNIKNQIKMGNYVDNMYHEYIININENKLTLSVGDINNFEVSASSEIDCDGKGSSESKYSHGYDDIFKTLTGEIKIRMSTDKPLIVIKNTDDYSVKYLIAPTI